MFSNSFVFSLNFWLPLQFRQEYLDTLYRYAKFQYECGNYSGAAEYLYFFRVLVCVLPRPLQTDDNVVFSSILLQDVPSRAI